MSIFIWAKDDAKRCETNIRAMRGRLTVCAHLVMAKMKLSRTDPDLPFEDLCQEIWFGASVAYGKAYGRDPLGFMAQTDEQHMSYLVFAGVRAGCHRASEFYVKRDRRTHGDDAVHPDAIPATGDDEAISDASIREAAGRLRPHLTANQQRILDAALSASIVSTAELTAATGLSANVINKGRVNIRAIAIRENISPRA